MPKIPRPKIKPFDNREPLECCEFASLQRQLGIVVSEEFTHIGLQRQMADCEYETVTVNTATFGGPKYIEEVADEKDRMTEKIIADIDEVVEELLQHKRRLMNNAKDSKTQTETD